MRSHHVTLTRPALRAAALALLAAPLLAAPAAAVEYEVGEVVVGNPINMNGTYGPRSEKCRMFADMLQNFLEIPVVMWDERSTTVTAHNMMNDVNKRGKERKKVIDAVAAAVILQNYLDYKANLLAREKAKQEEK